jgi:putative ABC transport system permease protein
MRTMISRFTRDARYALRLFVKTPSFTIPAIAALMLGFGVNIAVFTIVSRVLLRPLPYPQSEQLIQIESFSQDGLLSGFFLSDALEVARRDRLMSGVTFYKYAGSMPLTGQGDVRSVNAVRVSPTFFPVLKAEPAMGRAFTTKEFQTGGTQSIIISSALWNELFGTAREISGKVLRLDDQIYSVVGVMPVKFEYARVQPDVWLPYRSTPQDESTRTTADTFVIGRLKGGVSLKRLNSELGQISGLLRSASPKNAPGSMAAVSLLQELVGETRRPFAMFLSAAGLLFIVACFNVAQLLLARFRLRLGEISIRQALGATRMKIIQQLLIESGLLALAGVICGAIAGFWTIHIFGAVSSLFFRRFDNVSVDFRTLLFTASLCFIACVFLGILSATLVPSGKFAGISSGNLQFTGFIQRFTRLRLLLGLELSMTFLLLVASGLFMRSFWKLTHVKLGFNPQHVITTYIGLSPKRYGTPAQQYAFADSALEQVGTLGSVEAVGLTTLPLFQNLSATIDFRVDESLDNVNSAQYQAVSPGFFRLLEIPLLYGRDFARLDGPGAPLVVVINSEMASKFWHKKNPVGSIIRVGPKKGAAYQVIGVVADHQDQAFERSSTPELYFSFYQVPTDGFNLLVRSKNDSAVTAAVRQRLFFIDSHQLLEATVSLEEVMDGSVLGKKVTVNIILVFSLLALMLAIVGLYGVTSYTVSQRKHEIAVRMAVGADRRRILKLILKETIVVCLLALAVGVVGSLITMRIFATMLYGIQTSDPLIMLAAAGLVFAVTITAAYWPAHRASQIEPSFELKI